jgi:hypothetical protein
MNRKRPLLALAPILGLGLGLALGVAGVPCASSFAQDGKPVPPPLPALPATAPSATIKDVDGKVAEPGKLPEKTTPAARERWEGMVRASLDPKVERKPVTAFDLRLDVRRKVPGQSNDLRGARYQFLAPDYLRTDTGHGNVHLRGPKGSFFIDSSQEGKIDRIPLDVGRGNAEDRRQLEEELGFARNFVGLTDPRSLRVLRLVESATAPAALPDALKEYATTLAWLEIDSPDLFAGRTAEPGRGPRIARIHMGVDPKTQLVGLALVDDAGLPAVLLKFERYKLLDGFQVPTLLSVYLPDPPSGDASTPVPPAALPATATLLMTVMPQSTLRAKLTQNDFLPE